MAFRRTSANWQATVGLLSLLTKHRHLTWEMARRDIFHRYAGQMLGAIWALAHPMSLMGVYLFLFSVVFKMKLGGTAEMPLDYTTYLLSGLIPWLTFQETLGTGPNAVVGNGNLVKQVVFPIEVLPVKIVLAAMPTHLVLATILVGHVLFSAGYLHWTYLLVPVLIALQVMAMIGVAYVTSAISVYFRDLKDVIQISCLVGIYLMPVVYLPAMVPPIFRPILYLNPFSYMVWCYQDAYYFGRIEHPIAWVVFPLLSFGVFVLGYRVFRKLKPFFGSAL